MTETWNVRGVPEGLIKQVKTRCLELEQTIGSFVTQALEAKLEGYSLQSQKLLPAPGLVHKPKRPVPLPIIPESVAIVPERSVVPVHDETPERITKKVRKQIEVDELSSIRRLPTLADRLAERVHNSKTCPTYGCLTCAAAGVVDPNRGLTR